MIEISAKELSYVKSIKSDFYLRFGYYPEIILNKPENVEGSSHLSLSQLREGIQIFNKSIEIQSDCRKKEIVYLRKIYCMIASDYGYTLVNIGKSLNRDHSTVIHSLKSGYDLLETDEEFRNLYIDVSSFINPKIYPHARINEVPQEKQVNSRSNNDSKLHSRKYHVSRPNFRSREEFDILGNNKRAFREKYNREGITSLR